LPKEEKVSLPAPYYEDAHSTIYNCDCRDILPHLPKVGHIITDPPYMGVVPDEWDNQWADEAQFLAFVAGLLPMLKRLMADNGSLYLFAWPTLAARIEVLVGDHFKVLSSIVWDKKAKTGGGAGIDVTSLRRFWPSSERILLAEQKGSDRTIDGTVGYRDKCNEAARDVFGKYIQEIRKAHGLSTISLTECIGAYGNINHGGACSNWEKGYNVPTREQYEKIRGEWPGYFTREYEDLRREYEDLRREYEDLRREYEDLRRPFNADASMQWGDVWTFNPPGKRNGHPCEKPVELMHHITTISTRKGDTILDPFMGSGTTLVAAKQLGRKAIGIEISEDYCRIAVDRLRQGTLLFDEPNKVEKRESSSQASMLDRMTGGTEGG
jgi:site-specific DNA-methyltransferase (adenine-specific)